MADRQRRESKAAQRNRQRSRDSGSSGSPFTQLPGSVEALETSNTRDGMNLDFITYIVSDDRHPDRQSGFPGKGDQWFRRPYRIHRDVGPENKSVVCPASIGEPCPICEYLAPLRDDWDKNKDIIIAQGAKDRDLFNVIDLDNDDKGIQVLDISRHLFMKEVDDEINGRDDKTAGFFELEGGSTMIAKFKEKTIGKGGNPFNEIKSADFKDREPYDEKILDDVTNLDEVLIVMSYDEIKDMFLAEPSSDNKQEEEPEKKKGAGAYRRGTKEEPEPEKKEETKEDDSLVGKTVICEEDDDDTMKYEVTKDDGEVVTVKNEDGEEWPDIDRNKVTVVEDEKSSGAGRSSAGRGTKKDEEAKGDDKCPSDHEFGKDNGNHKDCDNCPKVNWDACDKVYESLKAK